MQRDAESNAPWRVLIVEDEDVLRLTFEQFLQDGGYEVHVASSYNEALELLEETDIDVVVSDIVLGGNTGIDLLEEVRKEYPYILVIMITGDPSVKTASEAVRLGAFDYLQKPVTGPALQRNVRLAVEQLRIARERDRFESQMEQYRAELDAIFNSVNAVIVTVAPDMTIRQANAGALALFDPEGTGLQGQRFDALYPAELREACDALRQTLEQNRPRTNVRVEAILGSDKTHVFSVNTTPLVDDQGEHMGAVLTARDLTRLTLLEQQLEDQQGFRSIIGNSAPMKEIFELIEDVAATNTTVLIEGESGTGKELVAEALHQASPRRNQPFIKVNCSALSEDILESELFGHVKGAFTGAIKDRIGRFESANGGTLFLDEMADISPRLQLRLLRILQEGEFERVGDSRTLKADVRVVAATNQSLPEKIESGEFRQDLYYRLNVVRIDVPSLRERADDIPLLVEFFCKRFNTQFNKEIQGVSDDAMAILVNYPWPGNVRELENCLERAFIVCHEPSIQANHLPGELIQPRLSMPETPNGKREGDLSRETILHTLSTTDWNIAKSARALGIARNTLYQKMRSLELSRPGGD